MRFLRKSAKFDSWFVDRMPAQYTFDVGGTTYDLRAFLVNPPAEKFPLQQPVWTRFRCNFRSPNGAEVEIVGRVSYRTKTVNTWGVRTEYYSVRDNWTFSVSVDGTLVAEGLSDVANIHDERLRNVIYNAHAAISEGCIAARTEANKAALDRAQAERDAAKRKADERKLEVNEKLDNP